MVKAPYDGGIALVMFPWRVEVKKFANGGTPLQTIIWKRIAKVQQEIGHVQNGVCTRVHKRVLALPETLCPPYTQKFRRNHDSSPALDQACACLCNFLFCHSARRCVQHHVQNYVAGKPAGAHNWTRFHCYCASRRSGTPVAGGVVAVAHGAAGYGCAGAGTGADSKHGRSDTGLSAEVGARIARRRLLRSSAVQRLYTISKS